MRTCKTLFPLPQCSTLSFTLKKKHDLLYPSWRVHLHVRCLACWWLPLVKKNQSHAFTRQQPPIEDHLHHWNVVFLALVCNVYVWRWLNEKQRSFEDGTSVSDISLVPLIFKGECVWVWPGRPGAFLSSLFWSLNCYLICVLLCCEGCEMVIVLPSLLLSHFDVRTSLDSSRDFFFFLLIV